MKQAVFIFAVGILGFVPAASLAANLAFSPASGDSVRAGQTFAVQIVVDPQNSTIYTAKAQVQYPADILEVVGFAFAGSWMPLAQPGYDLIDNNQGVLIKTAGYPGGLSAPQSLGTITFKVKQAGSAVVGFGGDSLALSASNTNVLSEGLSQARFSFTKPTVSEPRQPVAVQENKVASDTGPTISEPTQPNLSDVKTPPGRVEMAIISTAARINPIVLLVIAILLLGSILFLKEESRNKRIRITRPRKK
jgi:hypothetical protein